MPSSHPFVFGKSPRYGDFISLGLTPAQEAAWDDFGAALMARAAAHWGDAYGDMHTLVTMWRFVLPPQTLGMEGWTIGALSPSLDSVGRRFLLAGGIAGAEDMTMSDAEAIAGEMDECIWQSIVGGSGKEALADAMSQSLAGIAPVSGTGLHSRWWTVQGDENSAILPDDLFTVLSPAQPDEASSDEASSDEATSDEADL